MKLSNVRLTRVAATLALAGLALTACGGDDEDAGDDTAAATADDGAAATADEGEQADRRGDTAEGDDDEAGETITVDDVGDIPQECIDMMGDYMERLEPIVQDIDWESATMADFEAISEQLDTELSSIDDDMGECERYDFGDDTDSMAFAIDIAEDRAPGVVPYLEWIQNLQTDFSAGATGEAAADLPTDCQGAIDHMEGLMDEFSSMSEVSLADLAEIGNVTGVIGQECSTRGGRRVLRPPGRPGLHGRLTGHRITRQRPYKAAALSRSSRRRASGERCPVSRSTTATDSGNVESGCG